jgi:hypothetical protein
MEPNGLLQEPAVELGTAGVTMEELGTVGRVHGDALAGGAWQRLVQSRSGGSRSGLRKSS